MHATSPEGDTYGGAHFILHLEICWKKKPRILDFGGSTFFISLRFTNLQTSFINIELIERFKVTADIILILIHNNILQSFVWSMQKISMFSILKTYYFDLWFLCKSDSCISISSETMEKWRFQRYIGINIFSKALLRSVNRFTTSSCKVI